MYRHPLGAHVVGWWKGVLMSFQHRQDGTAGALVAGDVDRDGSIDIAQRTAPAFPQRVRGGAALQDGKGPGQRLERDDAAREARAAQTLAYCPELAPTSSTALTRCDCSWRKKLRSQSSSAK